MKKLVLFFFRSLVFLCLMCNIWLLYSYRNATISSSQSPDRTTDHLIDDEDFKNPMKKWPSLEKLRSKTPDGTQAATVKEMLVRLLPANRSCDFIIVVDSSLVVNGRDVFILHSLPNENRLRITASSGIAAAGGFQYYAKTFCDCHFSWSGNQLRTMPSELPVLVDDVFIVYNDIYRFYQNVCTFSYSAVWWNWTRWEKELDWMALNGINLPLALTGLETVFRRAYLKFGFTQRDFDHFFAGPAFLAWSRMGNMDGWGGPLPDNWYDEQLQLQHKILRRMRDFGMVPVLPAFSGHVPSSIEMRYPNVSVARLSDWGKFNSTFCCTYLIDHRDPLFHTIGTAILTEVTSEFGFSHVYSSDTFNELQLPATEHGVVGGIGRAVYESMVAVDPNAIWLMQGWFFLSKTWNVSMSKALLTSVPKGRMIVLDLQSELRPKYHRLESYFGQPWIWCMLLNFGAVEGLYGTTENVNRGPFRGRIFANSTMIGTGMTPEGIGTNEVMYELMSEMSYLRQPVSVDDWFADYAKRRYAIANANASRAWTMMSHTVLNCTQPVGFHGRFIITRRPSLKLESVVCYDPDSFLPAWDAIIAAMDSNDGILSSDLYLHDLVDVTREALVIYSVQLYSEMIKSFKASNVSYFNVTSRAFLDLLNDLELLLASDKHFLLGTWLEDAKALAKNSANKALYEYNARNQLTLWGPNGEILDYAAKQWSGIISHYFIPRWTLFINTALENLATNTTFNQTIYERNVFVQVEQPFTFDNSTFKSTPEGNAAEIAQYLHSKWRKQFGELRSTFMAIRRAKLAMN